MSSGWRHQALCAAFSGLPWIAEPEDCSSAAERAMQCVCGACPVRAECEAYVDRAGIVSGFWAGRDRTAVELSETGGAA